ncbi:MAG: hypothetical protein F6J90_06920 [Moorea sp. SIOASIH]|uniref:hypothetical protein n=1 Tax=Moorena sp. SIOASIH TaxID=2607817 RepID=UPI0013BD4900|nr:hypothetical protein [Moorena sp. SIOASIH]NEO36069.1 hypothetical protein [Moorena sp. SIOASIH]
MEWASCPFLFRIPDQAFLGKKGRCLLWNDFKSFVEWASCPFLRFSQDRTWSALPIFLSPYSLLVLTCD